MHAYRIAGIPYAHPIDSGEYPYKCKCTARFGAKYYMLIIIIIWENSPNINRGCFNRAMISICYYSFYYSYKFSFNSIISFYFCYFNSYPDFNNM